MMKARFVRVGNSQALMIPAAVMREHGWEVGDTVDLHDMATGIVAMDSRKGRSIARIAQRLVRENLDLVKRLAKV